MSTFSAFYFYWKILITSQPITPKTLLPQRTPLTRIHLTTPRSKNPLPLLDWKKSVVENKILNDAKQN